MAVLRWTFSDGTTTVTLPMNPDTMGSPFFTRTISSMSTTAGLVILTEGDRQAPEFTFSGVVLTAAHYELLRSWFYDGTHNNKRLTITDHFGRKIVCMTKSWEPKSRRMLHYPWAHDFTAAVVVISVGAPTKGDVW